MTELPADESNVEPLLKRWSRRKQSARAEPSAREQSTEPGNELPTDSLALTDEGAEDHAVVRDGGGPDSSDTQSVVGEQSESAENEVVLCDEDMPAIESLTKDSDVSCFLNKGVSDALRKKALRHLFMLPAFNIRDGLNDYDEDYTYFEPLGDTITSDMKFHAARKAREEEAAEALAQEESIAEREIQDAEQADAEAVQSDEDQASSEEIDGEDGDIADPDGVASEETEPGHISTSDTSSADLDKLSEQPVPADDGSLLTAPNNKLRKDVEESVPDLAMVDADAETPAMNVLPPTDRTSNE